MNAILFNYNEDDCPWYHFDSSYKLLLGACLIIIGVFGLALNGWLFVTFLHSHLLTYKSHLLIFNLCIASIGRNLVGFPFAGTAALLKRWIFGPARCQLYAFWVQFFSLYQMTALFSIILERYFLAKYYRYEKTLELRFYWKLIVLCWINSIFFATPPLFGYGKYSCDTTGTTCTLLWPSLSASIKQFIYIVPYVLICGILPVVAIFWYIGKAMRLETIYYTSRQRRELKRLTQSVNVLSLATLALWIPTAILIGWQWLPLLIYGYRPHVPAVLAILAPITSEAATSVPVLCYLAGDERLRAALLGRMRKQYALLRPDRAKRYYRA